MEAISPEAARNAMPTRMAMMAITTSISIKEKPRDALRFLSDVFFLLKKTFIVHTPHQKIVYDTGCRPLADSRTVIKYIAR